MPIWQWLGRDGLPDETREFEAALAKLRQAGRTFELEAIVRKFQLAAANAIVKVGTPVPTGDKQPGLSRVGPPNVIEDLLPIGSVLLAREALDAFNGKLPSYLRVFGDSQIATITAAL